MKDPIVQEFNGKLWISAEHHVHAVEYAMEIVAAAEREACAKVCEEDLRDVYIQQNKTVQEEIVLFAAIADCANAIRARGQE